MAYKVLLIDGDGTIIIPPQRYASSYAESLGGSQHQITAFFEGPFQNAMRGKTDLKELIALNTDIWHGENPDKLLHDWFAAENVISVAALQYIAKLRQRDVRVYLASNQEPYRAGYIREIMFPGVFDGMFFSCDLGHLKREPEYWQQVLDRLTQAMPDLQPQDILYLDDNAHDVAVAKTFGIDGRVYTGPSDIRTLMQAELA